MTSKQHISGINGPNVPACHADENLIPIDAAKKADYPPYLSQFTLFNGLLTNNDVFCGNQNRIGFISICLGGWEIIVIMM